jgi:type IV pilus assembly protein PilM
MAGLSGLSQVFNILEDVVAGIVPPSTVVGLSVGSSSIKLVELKKTGKTWKLLHFGIIQLPEDVIVNREIVNAIAVADSLKSLVAQIKLKNKYVCTALSGSSIVIKRMILELSKQNDVQDQIFWEAEQYLPFDIAEVIMDYQILSKSKDNKMDILLVGVKRSILESFMDCVLNGGLKPKIVDVEFFALQNVLEANYPTNSSEAVALVDIGATSLKFVVVYEGVPLFTKDSSIGGKNLTSEIQKHLGVSFLDAETLKTSTGSDPGTPQEVPQEVVDLMQVTGESFATEIKRAIDFYNASSSGAPVAFVLLSGGSSKIPGLSKMIEDSIGLPTQLVNPFNSISYDPAVFTPEYIESIGPFAAIPIGLALRAGAR